MEFVLFGVPTGQPDYLEECLKDSIYNKADAIRLADEYKRKGYKVRISSFDFSQTDNLINDFKNTLAIY
jgi:hypothetical protein